MDDGPRYPHRDRDALRVARLRNGDEAAFAELYEDWFDRVYDLARRIVRDDGRAAEVAQDAFLTAWRRIDSLGDAGAFGGWLLRIARNRALDVAGREQRSTTVDDTVLAAVDAGGAPVSTPAGFGIEDRLVRSEDPAAAAEDGEIAALVWEAADALGERDRTVLDLQLRHGLTPAEIGEVVGVNRNAANQLVHRVKNRLEAAVRARVLWRGDEPACPELRAALDAAGVGAFGDRAVSIAGRHATDCERCEEQGRLRLQPAALFGALPIMVAPFALKQQAAAALAAAGVPVPPPPAGGAGPASGADTGGTSSSPGTDGVGATGSELPARGPGGADTGRAAEEAAAIGSTTGATGVVGAGGVAPDPRDGASRRRRALAFAAAALLLVVGAVVVLAMGEDHDAVETTAATTEADDEAGAPESTEPADTAPTTAEATSTTEADETTTTAEASTTTSTAAPSSIPMVTASTSPGIVVFPPGGSPTTIAPPPPPTTAGPAPSTTAPTGPTTTRPPGSTTTTADPITASLELDPDEVPRVFVIGGVDQPVLTWATAGGASVRVQGPGVDRTEASGSTRVCPGNIVSSVCRSTAGDYEYTLDVYDAADDVVATRTVTLTIL